MEQQMKDKLRTIRIETLVASQSGDEDAYGLASRAESTLVIEALALGYSIQDIGDAQTGR